MSGTVRKLSFKQTAASVLSSTVLKAASSSSSTACMLFYHQPKTPPNIKERLAKAKK